MSSKVVIDLDELEKLAGMHCTQEEAAAWFGVSGKTMSYRLRKQPFKDVWTRGLARGKISLRRKQKQRADAGDRTMLIWLGKQWLEQKDHHELTTGVLTEVQEYLRLQKGKRPS